MRLVVVGAGALGTLFAARLAHAGHEIRLVARSTFPGASDRAELRVEGVDPISAAVELQRADAPHREADGVLVAVKAYDLRTALPPLAALGAVPWLLVQNGLGIERLATEACASSGAARPPPPIVRAVNSVPATWLGPGRVRQAGTGQLLLPREPAAEVRAAVETWDGLLTGAGFQVRRVADFEREIWRKLLVNAAINPVTADHGVENGRLAVEPWRGQALALLEEARAVAASEGIVFSREEAERELFTVVRATASNRSSMLQDLDRGRPTEIGVISGALLEIAEHHGLELPATRRALRQILRKSRPAAKDS